MNRTQKHADTVDREFAQYSKPTKPDPPKNFIAGAIKHPGALHKTLGVPMGQKIPAAKLEKATHSSNPTTARRARFAETLGKLRKGR